MTERFDPLQQAADGVFATAGAITPRAERDSEHKPIGVFAYLKDRMLYVLQRRAAKAVPSYRYRMR
jgi:hypothetical protein